MEGTSYGFRPGRGCKDALRRVQTLLDEGHTWIVDADLKGYFDTIPKDRLMSRVEGVAPTAVAIGQRVKARVAQHNGAGLVVFDLLEGQA